MKLYRALELTQILGISKDTLRRWVQAGTFPPPRLLNDFIKAWPEEEIQKWIQNSPHTDMKKREK